MELLKLATEWAKAEVFSTRFFILFGLLFIAASFGFLKLGKTDLAKAYIIPMLIAGILLLIIGVHLLPLDLDKQHLACERRLRSQSLFFDSGIRFAATRVTESVNI